MSEPTWTPNHGGHPEAGDYVAVLHDCESEFAADGIVRHDRPVLVTSTTACTVGTRIRAVRCDGSLVEWIEETDA